MVVCRGSVRPGSSSMCSYALYRTRDPARFLPNRHPCILLLYSMNNASIPFERYVATRKDFFFRGLLPESSFLTSCVTIASKSTAISIDFEGVDDSLLTGTQFTCKK